uniref:hypothetical protein n=1 Tax=Variovorax paradoxus TaxID=34073 RepID=UPI001ABC0860
MSALPSSTADAPSAALPPRVLDEAAEWLMRLHDSATRFAQRVERSMKAALDVIPAPIVTPNPLRSVELPLERAQ